MNLVIETIDLWHVYRNGVEALKGVNFKAGKGETTILLGRNGAGKTTLLLHFNGLLKPTKGEVLLEGKPIRYDKKSLFEVRKKVGLVFQNPDDQLIAPVVWQDVAFGLKNIGLDDREIDERVKQALKQVGLEGFENRLCNMLSEGEKKRVAIAGVVAMEPEVVIMDEPTAGLDGFGVRDIVEIVMMLKKEGKAIIISTHDIDFALEIGDRFTVMDGGKIIHEGKDIPEEIAEKCGFRRKIGGKLIVVPHNIPVPDVDADFFAAAGDLGREAAYKAGIQPNTECAAIEKSILKAIGGSTVLLICNAEMIKEVKKEALNYPVKIEVLTEGMEKRIWESSQRMR